MQDVVRYERAGAVAMICIDNPPVNALGRAVRADLDAAVAQFARDGDAGIAVILGQGRLFIGGADISEFGKPLAPPELPGVIARIEACDKPVVAAIHGAALGGGLEVALGCHYRLAMTGARLGLPEVTLGIIPGAGGTQRAPRLMGLRAALQMIPAGGALSAQEALELGLIDCLGSGEDIRAAALGYARDLLAQGAGVRRTGDMARPAMDAQAVAEARARWTRKARGEVARLAAIDAIEVSTRLDVEDGLAEERRIFNAMMQTEQRAGLVQAFFNDRKVARLAEIDGVRPRDVADIGVVGGGTMGAGIATAALMHGLPVVLVERDAAAAQAARGVIADNLAGAVARGKMSGPARDTALEALQTTTQYSALGTADVIIEAVFEEMDAKRAVFTELDRVAKPGAVLASNTSYLDLNEIAAAVSRPGDVIGLHFFSPAHVMRLLEAVVGTRTAPEVTASGFALARRLGKVAVRAGVCDGFIGNRILAQTRAAADAMVLAGASPYDVDAALEAFGFAMGPYATADLAGLDIGFAARRRRDAAGHAATVVPSWADDLVHMGRLGQKTGRGYYIYEGREDKPDPEVEALIAQARVQAGIDPRAFSDDEIVRRYMAALVNEAAQVVEEGIAARPLDVDVVLVQGYGFARWRGGPMHWADSVGLDSVLGDIQAFGAAGDPFWRPAPLLRRLVAQGATFASLNG